MLHLNSQLGGGNRVTSHSNMLRNSELQQQNSTSLILNHHALHLAQAGLNAHGGGGSSTTNHSFISPMRGGMGGSSMAAVPHHLNPQSNQQATSNILNSASNLLMGSRASAFGFGQGGMSRPHLNSQLQRDLSSSPYHQLNKKKGLDKLSRGVTISNGGGQQQQQPNNNQNPLFSEDFEPNQNHATTLAPGSGSQHSHPTNRLLAYNLITLEDAERKYLDILDNEKQQYKKKEHASREIIQELSRKLKQQEKRIQEDGKVATELKKRHDLIKKRLEKTVKDKQDLVGQLKSLFSLYTEQRKALQVSIQKTKRIEEENQKLEAKSQTFEETQRSSLRRLEQLEQERDLLHSKQRREREQLESELEEKRQTVKKLESDVKEASSGKLVMKKQIDEYENKVKKLIYEFEESSKKHIRELNDVHEQYRGYKSSSIELEQRIQQYKADMQRAQDSERSSKKEVHRLRLENDELCERLRFIDQRYNHLVQRFGASPEDLQEIDEQITRKNKGLHPGQQEDDESHVIFSKATSGANAAAHMKNQQSEKSHPFQKLVKLNNNNGPPAPLIQHDIGEVTEMEQEIAMINQAVNPSGDRARSAKSGGRRGGNGYTNGDQPQRRTESRLQRRAPEDESAKRERQLAAGQYLMPNGVPSREQLDQLLAHNQDPSEQLMLLQKLMGNLKENPALQNVYIREIFKLQNIRSEKDLQEYKNLLNSMAALFFTNHRMNDVNQLFQVWKQSAMRKQEERMHQVTQKKGSVHKPAPPRIQIDTELANQEAFKNYKNLNQPGAPAVGAQLHPQFIDDEPSEIPQGDDLRKNMMIHIEGDDNLDILNDDLQPNDHHLDPDYQKDLQVRGFLDDLVKVGPFAKQILNYSYPPLLYQRGDGDDEEDEDQDDDQGDEEDDEDAVRDILSGADMGGDMVHGGFQLPDFDDDDYEGEDGMDEDDREIQALVQGQNHYQQNPLMNFNGDDEDEEMEGFDGQDDGNHFQQIIDGGDLEDDEEFLAMMEQEAAHGRMLRNNNAAQGQNNNNNNSTIINSSQNTSLLEGNGGGGGGNDAY